MHPHAKIAIKAAQNFHHWGSYAARRYVERHGCPSRLYGIALLLESVKLAQDEARDRLMGRGIEYG